MSSALELDPVTERIAVGLLRHLEWQPEGFSLVFLFADLGPSLQMADWLDQRLSLSDTRLQREAAPDAFVRSPDLALDRLIAGLGGYSARAGAVWYAVQRHPGDAAWNRARSLFLARLNERRYLLERDLARPLLLVLPADFRSQARNIAPDLWHVRALSEELRAKASAARPESQRLPESGTAVATMTPRAHSLPAYTDWLRMQASARAEQFYLPTAAQAIGELLAAGRPADAQEVADAALAIARQRASLQPAAAPALRDLSVSLNNLGQVARAQGDWSQAGAVYRESLDLRRELVERLGGTPESLRDLSVSLNNLGRVAQAQGDWSQAGAVYRESLEVSRQLVERLGGTPESLRDLAVSLLNVAAAPGAEAAPLRAEALDLYRKLSARFPDVVRYQETLRTLEGDPPG